MRCIADDVVLVSEDAIRSAMALVADHLGLIVEPAGVAGLAALIADPERWRGRSVAIPLCGGNVDAPAPETRIPSPETSASVSYTHLDVYKRQTSARGRLSSAISSGACANGWPITVRRRACWNSKSPKDSL